MSTELAKYDGSNAIEQVLIQGDLAALKPAERVVYYRKVCDSLGLNYLTKPFDYIELNGKLTLYAKRDATDQIRNTQHVSVRITNREKVDDYYVVTAHAELPDGRTDEALAAVPLSKEDGEWRTRENGKRYFAGNGKRIPLRGDDYANALMKCETKAKRRVTLGIVGLGWLDETETDTIPDAKHPQVDVETGEIQEKPKAKPTPKDDEAKRKKAIEHYDALCEQAMELRVSYTAIAPDTPLAKIIELGTKLKADIASALENAED